MRDLLVAVLGVLEVNATTVCTEAEALKAVSEDGPYVLYTSCVYGIPGDAMKLAATIRRHDPGIAMIAYAGYDPESVRREAIRTGFDRFLPQPFGIEEFCDAICDSLAEHGHRDLAVHVSHCFQVNKLIHTIK